MLIVIIALMLVLTKGAFGGFFQQFTPCLYILFVVTVIFRAPKAYRFSLAALLGLVADVFSCGKFGGYALAFSLAYFPTSLIARYLSPEYAFFRFFMCFTFVFSSYFCYFMFGDVSSPITSLPISVKSFLITATFNGVLGTFLWPFFAYIIGRKGREVELIASRSAAKL